MYPVFNFSFVAVDIELSIRETAKHQPDRAVCGRVALTNRAYSLFSRASCHRETVVKVLARKRVSPIRFRCPTNMYFLLNQRLEHVRFIRRFPVKILNDFMIVCWIDGGVEKGRMSMFTLGESLKIRIVLE